MTTFIFLVRCKSTFIFMLLSKYFLFILPCFVEEKNAFPCVQSRRQCPGNICHRKTKWKDKMVWFWKIFYRSPYIATQIVYCLHVKLYHNIHFSSYRPARTEEHVFTRLKVNCFFWRKGARIEDVFSCVIFLTLAEKH